MRACECSVGMKWLEVVCEHIVEFFTMQYHHYIASCDTVSEFEHLE